MCEKTITTRRVDLKEVRRQIEEMIARGQVHEAVEALFAIIASMPSENRELSLRVLSLLRQTDGRGRRG